MLGELEFLIMGLDFIFATSDVACLLSYKSHIEKKDPYKTIYKMKGLLHSLPISFWLDVPYSNMVSEQTFIQIKGPTTTDIYLRVTQHKWCTY